MEKGMVSMMHIQDLAWQKDGLIPAVVQDAATGEVLTLAYVSPDSLAKTAELGETVRATLERCEAEGARNLYERANEHIVRARENLDRGLRDRAVAEARIARNLFNRVREICVQ